MACGRYRKWRMGFNDYVNIVVHVFQKHIREYYRIESLWGDANITTIETKY